MNANVTTGYAVVRALVENGVDLVFGIPGDHNIEIYRYLEGSGIRHVLPRHEQGGGYAADAYARASGRPGVLITTSGPGVTNAATPVATAFADSIPLLLISAALSSEALGRGHGELHEIKDQQAHMDAICDRSVSVGSAEHAYDAISEAFARWKVERPRPVHIELPVDMLARHIDRATVDGRMRPKFTVAAAPDEAIRKAAEELAGAKKPVLVVGGGAKRSCADVCALAERLQAPVLTTVNGKGVVPETHPLSLGSALRLDAGHLLIRDADVLVVIGAVLGEVELWDQKINCSGTIIRVDIDPGQIQENVPPDHALVGDAARILNQLLSLLPAPLSDRSLWADLESLRATISVEARKLGGVYTEFIDALRQVLPAETIIVGDSAQVAYLAAAQQWAACRPDQFLYPTTYGTLGYGIPGGIGASLARPDLPVITLTGDGGSMYTIQEFVTAVELELSLPVAIFNNGGYQEIREAMERRGVAPIACDMRIPDIAMLGRALGGAGDRVDSASGLARAVTKALARKGPTLIEVTL